MLDFIAENAVVRWSLLLLLFAATALIAYFLADDFTARQMARQHRRADRCAPTASKAPG